ncbi:MAG: hypothetical protein WKF36_09420 [Candidatus Nitrosocosmicus sp.]
MDLLARKKIRDNEIVLDAEGSGTFVTKIIADIVKKGKVYAVGTDDKMIVNAKKP